MCGRFALHATIEEIVAHFRLTESFSMRPRYNIAPTQTIPIMLHNHRGVSFSRWAFLPRWAKAVNGAIPQGYINARSETLMEKPAFSDAFKSQRCIIPISGYYEWKALQGKKQPFYISSRDNAVMGIAGICSVWQESAWEKIMTCAIITKPAVADFVKIHDRMPMILQPRNYNSWLNPKENLLNLEKLLADETLPVLQAFPVSLHVNSPHNDSAICIKPL